MSPGISIDPWTRFQKKYRVTTEYLTVLLKIMWCHPVNPPYNDLSVPWSPPTGKSRRPCAASSCAQMGLRRPARCGSSLSFIRAHASKLPNCHTPLKANLKPSFTCIISFVMTMDDIRSLSFAWVLLRHCKWKWRLVSSQLFQVQTVDFVNKKQYESKWTCSRIKHIQRWINPASHSFELGCLFLGHLMSRSDRLRMDSDLFGCRPAPRDTTLRPRPCGCC